MGMQAALERPDVAACYAQAERRHRQGDLVGALDGYDRALSIDPGHRAALHLSAMALYQLGDPAAALPRIEAAMAPAETDPEILGGYGVILAALNRATEAVAVYRRGLEQAPEDGALWFNLGLSERALGQHEAAIEALAAAAPRIGSGAAYHELGLAHQIAGREADAVRIYRQALALGAGAETALNAGAACQRIGQIDEAESFYRRALVIDPRCARALNNLALLAQDQNDLPRAAALCRSAIAIDLLFTDPRNNLGVALERLGDPEGAEQAYRAALSIDPAEAKTLANLAELLFGQNRGDEALALGQAAVQGRPQESRAWLSLAAILERADDLVGAAEALTQAARLDGHLWETHHRLGQVLQRQGDPRAALERHRRAAALAPGRAEAWSQLILAALRIGDADTALDAVTTIEQIDAFDPQAWAGKALALRLAGDGAAAEALTGREDLVTVIPMPPPAGYDDLDAFHQSLTGELARVSRAWSPRGQSVIEGSQTQNDLFGQPGQAIQALHAAIDTAVAAFLEDPGDGVRRFIPRAPESRRYRSWSVTLKAGGRHASHIHPEGQLSGVYYVRTPAAGSGGRGALVFGEPGVPVPLQAPPPTRVVDPRPGQLVLFPSYLWHGTQPFESSGERITVAFDLLR